MSKHSEVYVSVYVCLGLEQSKHRPLVLSYIQGGRSAEPNMINVLSRMYSQEPSRSDAEHMQRCVVDLPDQFMGLMFGQSLPLIELTGQLAGDLQPAVPVRRFPLVIPTLCDILSANRTMSDGDKALFQDTWRASSGANGYWSENGDVDSVATELMSMPVIPGPNRMLRRRMQRPGTQRVGTPAKTVGAIMFYACADVLLEDDRARPAINPAIAGLGKFSRHAQRRARSDPAFAAMYAIQVSSVPWTISQIMATFRIR